MQLANCLPRGPASGEHARLHSCSITSAAPAQRCNYGPPHTPLQFCKRGPSRQSSIYPGKQVFLAKPRHYSQPGKCKLNRSQCPSIVLPLQTGSALLLAYAQADRHHLSCLGSLYPKLFGEKKIGEKFYYGIFPHQDQLPFFCPFKHI